MKSAPHIPQDAYQAIDRISDCENEADVSAITSGIVRSLGAGSFVYSTLVSDDRSDDRDSYRFFIGCSMEWCRMYNERKWFMNDPFVEYARFNSAPILGSAIVPQTDGQKEMLRTAADYGFRSGIVIPTHSSMNVGERMGMLYIGCSDPPEIGEPLLKAHRIFYRVLGMELLDWWTKRLRDEAARKYRLTDEEIHLLQLTKNGCVVAEISAKLNMKPSAIYSRLSVIKDKLNVEKIGEAVRLANYSGLLG